MHRQRNASTTKLNRRELLRSAGALGAAAAGGLLLPDIVLAQEDPSAAVEDAASRIRIAGVDPFIAIGKVYIKITTNYNVTGWGEISAMEPNVASALVKSLREILLDQNPTRIEFLWQRMYRSHRDIRGGPFMVHTISGIDMALWDIAGKLWKTPVYRLLGGPVRDKLRVYTTDQAVKVAAGGSFPFSADPADVQGLVDRVKEGRKKVGPKGAVMFDAHSCLPPATLIQFASAIEPYDVLFIEEPWVPGNIEVCKKIRNAVKVPLATGERDRTIWEFVPYLQAQVVDIVQPDVCHSGGISQLKKIAAIAEAYQVALAPHNTASYLGLTASLHLAASVPLFLIHEAYTHTTPIPIPRKTWTIDNEGYASLPEGVGLCVEIDEKLLANAAEPGRKFWPDMRLKDGSVADY